MTQSFLHALWAVPPAAAALAPSHGSPRLGAAPRVPGESWAHLAPRAPGHCALVATSPGAQLLARSLPDTLK